MTKHYGYRSISSIIKNNMTSRTDLVFELYLLGRKIRFQSKHKNEDKLLSAVILHLVGNCKHTISAMAQLLSTKISAISEKIIILEKMGLIKKIEGANHRETYLILTSKGNLEKERIMKIMKEHCLTMFDKLSDEDLTNLIGLIKKINLPDENK